jgi:hypothetical protein
MIDNVHYFFAKFLCLFSGPTKSRIVSTHSPLPMELLRMVGDRLHSVGDRVRISSVCRHWHSAQYEWPNVKKLIVDGWPIWATSRHAADADAM